MILGNCNSQQQSAIGIHCKGNIYIEKKGNRAHISDYYLMHESLCIFHNYMSNTYESTSIKVNAKSIISTLMLVVIMRAIQKLGMKLCVFDGSIYTFIKGQHVVLLAVYVDGTLITGNDEYNIRKIKQALALEFKI